MKINDLQKIEKPREKLMKIGAENLTDVELVSIILRSGGKDYPVTSLSRDLINKFGGIKELLLADIEEILEFKNIDTAKASSLKAVEEISKRYLSPSRETPTYVKTPKDVYDIVRKDIFNKNQEYLFLLCLDSRNKLISKDIISKGTLNETLIHPREIFKKAVSKNSCYIILAHNHPSEKCEPSDEDIKVTKRIHNAGINMGIPLIDHVIVTNDNFSSMKSSNLISCC
jgi:DNA repair protein RadC